MRNIQIVTNSMTRRLTQQIAAAAGLVGVFFCSSIGVSSAADQAAAGAKSTVVFAGADAREKNYYPYAGLIHHFNGDITGDGVLLRVFGLYSIYSYTTNAVATGDVDAHATAFDVMVGYQKALQDFTLRGFLGLDYEDHHLSPDNPFDANRGSDTGVKVQGEVETNYGSPYYGSLIGSFGSAKDRYWTRLRGGYNFRSFIVGPEGLLTGDQVHDEQRVGAFIMLTDIGPVLVSFSTGYSHTNENRGGGSPYGSIEISTSF